MFLEISFLLDLVSMLGYYFSDKFGFLQILLLTKIIAVSSRFPLLW